MLLIFEQQQIEYEKTPSSDDVIGKINELLSEDYYFSHFIADGTEIYEDHEEYLNVNLKNIKKLEVIAKTEKEFMNDVLLSTEDYFKRAKPDLASLPEDFYSNPTVDTWTSFDMLLEGAGWLNDMLAVVEESKERPVNWIAYAKLTIALQQELAKLGQAVERKNHVQIGDIIRDGIIPNYAALEAEIERTIDAEGTREGLS